MTMSMSEQNWATREDVRVSVREILEHIDRRLDERNRHQDSRHQENIDRMETVIELQRITNGRISKLEALYGQLDREFQSIRKRWHDFRDSVQKFLHSHKQTASTSTTTTTTTSDERPLTRKELGWVLALIVTCLTIGATFAGWIISSGKVGP